MFPPKIYGLVGYPVSHSLSAVMHNVAFKALKIPAAYILIPVKPEELKDFLINNKKVSDIDGNPVSIQDLSGFNVTIPYKVRIMEEFGFVAGKTIRKEKSAVLVGAVNTVKIGKDILYYHNTDAEGFVNSLRNDLKFNPDGKNIFLFGCGGAGRAVIAGLMPQEGFKVSKIYIYEVNKEAAETTEKHFSNFNWIGARLEFISESQISSKIKTCDLLVNASAVGMKEGDCSVINKDLLNRELYVYDVVYNRKTQLIIDAQERCKMAKGGLGMLLYQGVSALEYWIAETGKKAPIEAMRKALERGLNR